MHEKTTIAAALRLEMEAMKNPFLDKKYPENWQILPPSAGKWTPLQQLDHLVLSVIAVNKALKWVPKFVIRYKYGVPNRVGRTYDELTARYDEKIKTKNLVNNPYSSGIITLDQREKLLQHFETEHVTFIRLFSKWSEKDLDAYLFPHPLLGKITVRELLFFMVHHVGHHRKLMLASA
jgi:DinB superfamily